MFSIQTIIVFVLFALAIAYLGRMLYRSLSSKKGCGANCKCGVDFSGLPQEEAN